MYTNVIISHASSEQDQMGTGVSSESGSQGRSVWGGAVVNLCRYNTFNFKSNLYLTRQVS